MRNSSKLPYLPVTVEVPSSASPSVAFRVIVPIDLSKVFRRWGPFPAVLGVTGQTGAWDAAGQSRFPQLSDGSTAHERLTQYTAPHSFAYEISEFTNSLGWLVDKIRGEWTMTPDGDGTVVRWTYSFYPRRGRRGLVRLVLVPFWGRYAARMLRATVDYVEAPSTAAA
jgi:Polyketide cyclase / dehydrase and lipid transport